MATNDTAVRNVIWTKNREPSEHMMISCLAKGYASYGGSIHTVAAEHLEFSLKEIEPIDLTVRMVAFISHDGPAKRTLEYLLERHNLKFPQKVRARYQGKAGTLNVEYPSSLRKTESFGKFGGIFTVAHVLPKALDEVSGALVESLRSKPAIWDKIDFSHLMDAIEKSKASLPANPDQILAYMRKMDEERRASWKKPSSIDDLKIDWAQYHPTARKVLNAPFFWSETDDDAPHGNDTGSDLIAAFKSWNKRNPDTSYAGFTDRLLSKWEKTTETAQDRLDEIELKRIREDADIALAFAVIKFRGACEEHEARVAIEALDRIIERLGHAPDRAGKASLLRTVLYDNMARV